MKYNFNKNTKIYVAGHKGLIGSAFIRFFKKNDYTNIITKDKLELDLTCKGDTINFFRKNQPEVVILAVGKVGGIIQNRDYPADFIFENLSIQLNVLSAAHEFHVKQLIFFCFILYVSKRYPSTHEGESTLYWPSRTDKYCLCFS